MDGQCYAVLLRDPARPEHVYAGRVELERGAAVFVCEREGRLLRERISAADVVSATRGDLRLRTVSAAELVLRSGRRLHVAVLTIGGLSQLLEALVELSPATGA